MKVIPIIHWLLNTSPPGCLKILDTEFSNSGILPNLTQLETDGIPLSNLTQIIFDPKVARQPPRELFSNEPEHDWCYFFEKADLARQMRDWQTIDNLGSETIKLNLMPRNPSEWLPFIEAYIRLDKPDEAKRLMDNSIKNNEKYLSGICYSLKRIIKDTQINKSIINQIHQFEEEYNCPS